VVKNRSNACAGDNFADTIFGGLGDGVGNASNIELARLIGLMGHNIIEGSGEMPHKAFLVDLFAPIRREKGVTNLAINLELNLLRINRLKPRNHILPPTRPGHTRLESSGVLGIVGLVEGDAINRYENLLDRRPEPIGGYSILLD
jgi:hypothetical protein